MIIAERDAEKLAQAVKEFGGMTDRQMMIYLRGIADGKAIARDEVQPDISDLELRIAKAAELAAHAVKALYAPSF
jgi:hypothetical protein